MRLCKTNHRKNVNEEGYIEYKELPKNYLKTKHFIASTVATIAGIIIAVHPNIEGLVLRNTKFKEEDVKDMGTILSTIIGVIAAGSSGIVMHDRVTNQKKVYTPRGIVGHNLEDVIEDI